MMLRKLINIVHWVKDAQWPMSRLDTYLCDNESQKVCMPMKPARRLNACP
jgi:hypothetical protein